MVNEIGTAHKSWLLALLRDSALPISGDSLGRQIGVSRVAVHKHLRHLVENDYPIITTRHGYMLGSEKNLPLTTWEFRPEEHIMVVKTTESTMNKARLRAEKHPGEDFTLAAEKQSAGRGRRNRLWDSPIGGLWATRVIHPGGSAFRIQKYVLAAAVALARLLRDEWNIDAVVKWPNDILFGKKKIAGILAEARITGDRIEYLSLGLGLNVNNIASPGATALKDITGREEDRRRLLRNWVAALDLLRESSEFAADGDPAWWNSLMTGIGEKATYFAGGQKIRGIVTGADSLGRLRLTSTGGSELRLYPGDVDDTQIKGQQKRIRAD